MTAPAKVSAAAMNAEQRAIAEVRAAKCFTCSLFSTETMPGACGGCGRLEQPLSCQLAYCPACSHDPRFEVVP